MFRQLFSRGSRLMYLSMLILTLSGAVLVAVPQHASAQMTTDPTTDPRCRLLSAGNIYGCRDLLSSTLDYRPMTTTESCNLGWSSRQANQEVTTTDVYQVDETLVELYRWDGISWYLAGGGPVTSETYLYTTVEYGLCQPITGRPPKN